MQHVKIPQIPVADVQADGFVVVPKTRLSSVNQPEVGEFA